MKVIYFSKPFFADCAFPLVKALQNKGVDVHYYIPLNRNFLHSSILEFEKPVKRMGLVNGSSVKEMSIYKDCIDLNKCYLIMGYPLNKYWIPSWCLWLFTLLHMKRFDADVILIDWHFLNHFEEFLFKFTLGRKKVMIVHDPIMHSGVKNANHEELRRIRTFNWADQFVLLNKGQTDEFRKKYNISSEKVIYSRLGAYTSLLHVKSISPQIKGKYILFFGQINPNKGLEYLTKAMSLVHEEYPEMRLVIAGGGNLYFDAKKYQNCDYIEWRNYYVGVSELVGLIKGCLFTICPYKDATQSGVVQTSFVFGKPVIATDVGNMSEVIKDGITGVLIPPCDIISLKNAIIKLYNDLSMQRTMANNIMNYNITNDCWNEIADDYIKSFGS